MWCASLFYGLGCFLWCGLMRLVCERVGVFGRSVNVVVCVWCGSVVVVCVCVGVSVCCVACAPLWLVGWLVGWLLLLCVYVSVLCNCMLCVMLLRVLRVVVVVVCWMVWCVLCVVGGVLFGVWYVVCVIG